jgi:hypothetical protein
MLVAPSMARMLPIEVRNLLGGQACQRLLDVLAIASPVVPLHPEISTNADEENKASCRKVETVANAEAGGVFGEIRPGGDETTNIAKHDL